MINGLNSYNTNLIILIGFGIVNFTQNAEILFENSICSRELYLETSGSSGRFVFG